jgi:hypothetical protein
MRKVMHANAFVVLVVSSWLASIISQRKLWSDNAGEAPNDVWRETRNTRSDFK